LETIAVYWEENIRTYGIQVEKNLCLAQADILTGQLAAWGQQLVDLGRQGTAVRLILAHQHEPEKLLISMVLPETFQEKRVEFKSRPAVEDVFGSFSIESPVEMLYFHGPHFGDRYGIADMACHALHKNDVRFIAMGCSAASVYFVFPEDVADRAQKALGSVFHTP
jgi:aspartokinase